MDPIADMITRIKNTQISGQSSTVFPYSKMKFELATILQKEGFLKNVSKKGKKVTKSIEVELVYEDDRPKINGVERVSKPSRRTYVVSRDIKPVKNNLGRLIISTSRGLMTDSEARKARVGGEALFKI